MNIAYNKYQLTLHPRQILTHVWAMAQEFVHDRDKTQTSIINWQEFRRKTNCVKHNSLSSENNSHNFSSFLNRVNDGDDLRFSGSKFQSWLAF